ncbi:MAG: preprotein translocase subunit SecE [Ignavibacteriales bacterium]|jgi:preprotein translocase subunit SecE|nr:preprotein translocase subunit SecE [Ignavibacteriales bacterium]
MKEEKKGIKGAIVGFIDDVVKEMKKVTWPTQEELKESTMVVLVSCLAIAALSYLVDMSISQIFNAVFG